MPEFSRVALEVLRQPLEDRCVTISRANGNFTYPTNILFIAAMNPCPCGYLGHPDKACKDTQLQIDRYRQKISGPLWDRIDMHIEVPLLRYQDMMCDEAGESSASIRSRVQKTRDRQKNRFGCNRANAQMSGREVKKFCPLDSASQDVLKHAIDVLCLSARACDRLLRVALTIADLEEAESMTHEHVMEAIHFRRLSL